MNLLISFVKHVQKKEKDSLYPIKKEIISLSLHVGEKKRKKSSSKNISKVIIRIIWNKGFWDVICEELLYYII